MGTMTIGGADQVIGKTQAITAVQIKFDYDTRPSIKPVKNVFQSNQGILVISPSLRDTKNYCYFLSS